jgi:hypothetical protein
LFKVFKHISILRDGNQEENSCAAGAVQPQAASIIILDQGKQAASRDVVAAAVAGVQPMHTAMALASASPACAKQNIVVQAPSEVGRGWVGQSRAGRSALASAETLHVYSCSQAWAMMALMEVWQS